MLDNIFNRTNDQDKKIERLTEEVKRLRNLIQSKNTKIKKLNTKIEKLEQDLVVDPKDRYRIGEGIMPLGMVFTKNRYDKNTGISVPDSPIPGKESPDAHLKALSDCAAIYKNPLFNPIIEYLINFQGNYTWYNGNTYSKELNGRSVIEGLELYQNFMAKAYDSYVAITTEQEDGEDANDISTSEIAEEVMSEFNNNLNYEE